MLRIVQNISAAGAKTYYSTSDYYTEGQELAGIWRGEGAKRLGLAGKIEKETWETLCDNRDPATGLTLTSRRKSERRVGYDFNFHVPKSVSLLYAISRDERIVDAFRDSVNETMRDMEAETMTRVRRGGKNEDRHTGNMVWGEFIHFTSRPVDGVPDPHLHAHCFVHNVTFDDVENRWKAGQFAGIKRDAPYFEAVFHSRLARKIAELGLPVERTKQGWEIAGLGKATLDKFSRRTALIEDLAREKGITDESEKSELGAKTRERKQKKLTMGELRREWLSRLSSDESDTVSRVGSRIGASPIAERDHVAKDAAIAAIEHSFERKSVVPERQVLTEAMKRSFGCASVKAVTRAVESENLIVGERDGRRVATTSAVLQEEQAMVEFARAGRGQCVALVGDGHAFNRQWLNDQQRKAVEYVLTSRDRVMVIRGAAGTGKTSMMQEAVEAIEAAGTKVFTFAPSADASRGVLRAEGFKDAETVARLLKDQNLQREIAGQVVWIDEAGLLGTRTMAQVFNLAKELDARVVLSGDRSQHGSVERGAALRLLETDAGLAPAEIRDIQRQKGDYKQAVKALSEGRTDDGFAQLDKLGWIREVGEMDRYKALARDYVQTVTDGKSALVVSPTHREGEWVTDEIRSELRHAGKLKPEQRKFTVLENTNLTVAERRDAVNFLPGDVLVFHQNAKGYQKGQRVVVGNEPMPLADADKFTAYHANSLPLSPGDVIRITKNGQTADGNRLNNGAIFTVKGFDKDGDIRLGNGWTLDKDFGHWTYGYVVTSHASQGKTVDRVFIGQSSESFPASSREQFYVSVSRGRERATVYTDDKAALLDAVRHSDERVSATELVAERDHRQRVAVIQRMNRETERPVVAREPAREKGVSYEQ